MRMLLKLRRAGASLVLTIPRAFADQNGLHDGSYVSGCINGEVMTLRAVPRPQYELAQLMAQCDMSRPLEGGALEWQ